MIAAKWMPPNNVCQHYGFGRTTLYDLLNAGLIAARKVGRRTLIDVESLDRYFASLPPAEIRRKVRPGRELHAPASAPVPPAAEPPRRGRGRPRKVPAPPVAVSAAPAPRLEPPAARQPVRETLPPRILVETLPPAHVAIGADVEVG